MSSHSSRAFVTEGLKRPTRTRCGSHPRVPIWPCSRRGLPSHAVLPPVRCALTAPFHPYRRTLGPRPNAGGGLLSAALSVSSRFPGVTWRPVLWSPDFPLAAGRKALPPATAWPAQGQACYGGPGMSNPLPAAQDSFAERGSSGPADSPSGPTEAAAKLPPASWPPITGPCR